ncbi:MAG: DUF5011 domain-containing protein [Clostridia bacterium]|nr:DUF5011 domain-containing protein [Clostridia bacterium]
MSDKSRRYYYANLKKDNSKKAAEKAIKKLPKKSKIAIALFFLIGAVIAYFGASFICKNDCFEIYGKKSIVIEVNTTYTDDGAKMIAFGQDASQKLTIEVYKDSQKLNGLEDIDTSLPGTYQIVYKSNSIRFKDVQLIRTVTITEVNPEEPPEADAYPVE